MGGMAAAVQPHFLGVPGVDGLLFAALAAAALCTNFIGISLGAAGGLALLAILAMVFPPGVLVPVHTAVQLGSVTTRTAIMWRRVLRGTVLPFLLGAVAGAAGGAQVFVALPTATLQGVLGGFILVVAWMPKLGRFGPERGRFAALGFVATFLGMFVSATGSLLAPFIASTAPDRRDYAATFAALMTILHLSKLVAFGTLGLALGAYLPLIAAMIAASAVGNVLGRMALVRMSEDNFRVVFKCVLSLLALRLLWVAARAAGLV